MSGYLRFSFDPTLAVSGTIGIAMAVMVALITERLVRLEALHLGELAVGSGSRGHASLYLAWIRADETTAARTPESEGGR